MNQIQPNHTAVVLNTLLKLDTCAFQLFHDLMSRMECEVSKYNIFLRICIGINLKVNQRNPPATGGQSC